MGADGDAENERLRARVAELEARLAERDDSLERVIGEHAPAFMNVITPEGRFLATGRTSESFGSVLGRTVWEFSDPASHATMKSAFARALATMKPVVYEAVGFGESGEPGHVFRVRAVPIERASEGPAIVLVPVDVTDHVRLEQSARESKAALEMAVAASRTGLWRWDLRTDKVEWDNRVLEIWGLSEPPRDYASYLATIHPDDRQMVMDRIRTGLESGVFPTFEHRLLPTAEGERWVISTGRVLFDSEGKPSAIMGGAFDVSDQKRLESQLRRAARVEAIGQLAAGIAHNFNNLLAAIIPNVEHASALGADAARGPLDAALDAALRARELVANLLSLAKRGEASEGEADPATVVAHLEAMCRATFPRNVEMQFSVAPGVAGVVMGAMDLEHVLLNLLFNARDAVEEASSRRIELHVDEEPDASVPRVRFRVTDTGAGMTAEVCQRIFEPFFTTKGERGSGLGLAHSQARVREVGGDLVCTTAPGVGTTFTLLLPVRAPAAVTADGVPAVAPVASDAGAVARAPDPAVRAPHVDGETILVIDDEPAVRRSMRLLLEGEQYRVVEASSAAAARDVLAHETVSLIILDDAMGNESGVAALGSLRERSSAPVVLFTGMAPGSRPEGVAAVLSKPALRGELSRVTRQVLDAASSRRA